MVFKAWNRRRNQSKERKVWKVSFVLAGFKVWEHEKEVYQLYIKAQQQDTKQPSSLVSDARPQIQNLHLLNDLPSGDEKSRWATSTPATAENGAAPPTRASRWSPPSVSNTLAEVKVLSSGHIVPSNMTAKEEESLFTNCSWSA